MAITNANVPSMTFVTHCICSAYCGICDSCQHGTYPIDAADTKHTAGRTRTHITVYVTKYACCTCRGRSALMAL